MPCQLRPVRLQLPAWAMPLDGSQPDVTTFLWLMSPWRAVLSLWMLLVSSETNAAEMCKTDIFEADVLLVAVIFVVYFEEEEDHARR